MIIAGLQSNNLAFVMQGGLVVALLAILLHGLLTSIERYAVVRLGGRGGSSL